MSERPHDPEHAARAGAGGWGPRRAAVAGCALVLLAAAAIRWRLLDVPFERDEGVYAYFGRALLDGIPPYVGVYGMRLPGIYALYAGILAVFPDTPRGVHLALLLVNAGTALCVFGLARRVLGDAGAGIAAGTFSLLSLTYGVQGAFANTEHFVLLFAVPSLWLLLSGGERARAAGIGLAGLGLGLALLVKQHGAAFALGGGLWLLVTELRREPRRVGASARRLGLFSAGVALPVLLTGAIYLAIGGFGDLWFWTVEYASGYAAPKPFARAYANLRSQGGLALGSAPALWAAAALGVPLLVAHPRARRRALFLATLLLASLLALVPGFVFRPHAFLFLVPAASLFTGVAATASFRLLTRRLGAVPAGVVVGVALAACVLHVGWLGWRYLFTLPPDEIVRIAYPGNPFHESIEIAEFVRARTRPDDRIAVLGSEPQIYFYANRRAATGFIYVYPLMEPHAWAADMQRRMIDEIERADPEVLIFVRVQTSWLRRADSPELLEQWFATYRERYELVGLMEIQPRGSRFHTGDDLARLTAMPATGVGVYQRRPAARP